MKHFFDLQQESIFKTFLEEWKLSFSEETLEKLYLYAECVLEGNKTTNLISKNDTNKFLTRHLTDSLMPFILLKDVLHFTENNTQKYWADMGSGSGCPVFPLAIVLPNIKFYAVEPRNLRVRFLQKTKQKLDLKNLEVVGKRFETSDLNQMNFISCRALSTFENDWERAQKGLKNGGYFITLKSLETILHLKNDPAAIIRTYRLPNEEKEYALVYKRYQ